MNTYRINEELNGIEIMFDEIPTVETRGALKAQGFRWHKKNKYWYAKQTAERLDFVKAFNENGNAFADWTGETSEGYMGAIRWDGNNSGKFLYGAELSKAIRDDLKQHGIKGVTVSVKTYSGGQHITAKIKVADADFIPFDEWKAERDITDFERWGWLYKNERFEEISFDDYIKLDDKEKAAIFEINARHSYNSERTNTINHYHMDKYTTFGEALKRKVELVNDCIKSYNYDDSNGMVDYFDTNFYYDIELVEK